MSITDGWRNEEVHEALDLCLSCKACKTECPVNVDMATWKSEFLAHHYQGRMHPLQHYLFGFMDRWAHLAAIAPALANLPHADAGRAHPGEIYLGRRAPAHLPRVCPAKLPVAVPQTCREIGCANATPLLLWPDTWNNYFHPQATGRSRTKCSSFGWIRRQFPEQHICCGRPLYDFGFLDQARAYLMTFCDASRPQIDAGMPFVVLEPCCASVFRDELINFFPHDERAQRLAKQTFLLSEFLIRAGYRPPQLHSRQIVLHGHCHHKSLVGMQDELSLLQATSAQVNMLDSGCCGMAGPFGFEKDKYRSRRPWASACFCRRCVPPPRKRSWLQTASVAGNRSGKIRRATPCIWLKFWPGAVSCYWLRRHNDSSSVERSATGGSGGKSVYGSV